MNKKKPRAIYKLATRLQVSIDPLIDRQVFAAVAAKRHDRSPAVTPARVVNTPTLLTGLLRCDACGAGMTTATGKGGRYQYYKCNTRIGRGAGACCTPAVSMPKMDNLVLAAFADKVLTPERLREMLREMKQQLKQANSGQDDTLRTLKKELVELETGTNRLYEAVEKGLLPMDDMLKVRAQKLKARRDAVLIEVAGARRMKELPVAMLSARQLERLCRQHVGMGPASLYRQLRMRYANWLIENTDRSVTDIANEAGFADCAHFSRQFKDAYGLSPSTRRLQPQRAANGDAARARVFE